MAHHRRHILIVALRRSGTTTLWRTLRQDQGYIAYDEPFGRLLGQLPDENIKQVRAEFITLFNRDPAVFRASFAPILRPEEVATDFTPAQADYLQFLLNTGPCVIDMTRCMGKIPALAKIAPDAVLVHLHRSAGSFASSHLLPSDRRDVMGLRRKWRERQFFSLTRGFNRWGMEDLTTGTIAGATRQLFAGVDVPLGDESSPALHRLMQVWRAAHQLAERDGPAHFGDRFHSVSFEDFCADPIKTLTPVYASAETALPEFDISDLRPANAPFRPDHDGWHAAHRAAGLHP